MFSAVTNWAGEKLGGAASSKHGTGSLVQLVLNVVDKVKVHEKQMLEVERGRGSQVLARVKGRGLVRVVWE